MRGAGPSRSRHPQRTTTSPSASSRDWRSFSASITRTASPSTYLTRPSASPTTPCSSHAKSTRPTKRPTSSWIETCGCGRREPGAMKYDGESRLERRLTTSVDEEEREGSSDLRERPPALGGEH